MPNAKSRGPHVQVAAICEKVIEDKDNVLSLIRIVDRVTQTASGIDPPKEMPPSLITNVSMVVALKADMARGRHSIRFIVEAPSGLRTTLGDFDVNFTPGNAGVNLVSPLQFAAQHEGVYWFDVTLDGDDDDDGSLLTRVPLEVVYRRQRLAAPSEPPSA